MVVFLKLELNCHVLSVVILLGRVNISQYSLPPEKNYSLPHSYAQSHFHNDAKSHYFMLVVFLCANYHRGGLRNWCFNLKQDVI